jgi:hypothetical protein
MLKEYGTCVTSIAVREVTQNGGIRFLEKDFRTDVPCA